MLLAAVLICILSRSVASLELDEVKAEGRRGRKRGSISIDCVSLSGLCDELIAVAQVAVHEKNLEKALESLASVRGVFLGFELAYQMTHTLSH